MHESLGRLARASLSLHLILFFAWENSRPFNDRRAALGVPPAAESLFIRVTYPSHLSESPIRVACHRSLSEWLTRVYYPTVAESLLGLVAVCAVTASGDSLV